MAPVVNSQQSVPVSDRGARSREQIMDATVRVMIDRRTIDITLGDIAGASNLNGALVRYYFGSKDGLLLAVLMRSAEKGITQLRSLVEIDMPPDQKLRYHIAGMVNTYSSNPYFTRLRDHFKKSPDSPECERVTNEFNRPFMALQSELLRQGIQSGHFRPVDYRCFYLAIIGACNAIVDLSNSAKGFEGFGQGAPLKSDYIEYVTDLHLRGLLK